MRHINIERKDVRRWLELLKGEGSRHKKLWKKVYSLAEKPARERAEVNIDKISKYTRKGDIVIVPGKVLGMGSINHEVTIAAISYSEKAKEALSKANCKIADIADIYKMIEEPNAKSSVKILV